MFASMFQKKESALVRYSKKFGKGLLFGFWFAAVRASFIAAPAVTVIGQLVGVFVGGTVGAVLGLKDRCDDQERMLLGLSRAFAVGLLSLIVGGAYLAAIGSLWVWPVAVVGILAVLANASVYE